MKILFYILASGTMFASMHMTYMLHDHCKRICALIQKPDIDLFWEDHPVWDIASEIDSSKFYSTTRSIFCFILLALCLFIEQFPLWCLFLFLVFPLLSVSFNFYRFKEEVTRQRDMLSKMKISRINSIKREIRISIAKMGGWRQRSAIKEYETKFNETYVEPVDK